MIGVQQAVIVGGSKKLWTPANTTTALWLDAADSSSVATSSGMVTQWNDKSGNNKHATPEAEANRPTYTASGLGGRNVVTFSGNPVCLTNSTGLTTGTYTGVTTMYGVMLRTSGKYGTLFTERNSATVRSFSLIDIGIKLISSDAVNGTTNNAISISDCDITVNPFIVTQWQKMGYINQYWLNGTSITVLNATTTNSAAGTDGFSVGKREAAAGYYFTGYIGELIIETNELVTSTHKKFEGYLAHKWGLTTNLPLSHPYKYTPPYTM